MSTLGYFRVLFDTLGSFGYVWLLLVFFLGYFWVPLLNFVYFLFPFVIFGTFGYLWVLLVPFSAFKYFLVLFITLGLSEDLWLERA